MIQLSSDPAVTERKSLVGRGCLSATLLAAALVYGGATVLPVANPKAYNSLWQFKADAWSSPEDAAVQLTVTSAGQRSFEDAVSTVTELLEVLGPVGRLYEYLMPDEVEQRVENGQQVVSANFVTPYPPGYPVLVPGQVFSQQILSFMRSLDTPEVHGNQPDLGYRVYIDKALEIAGQEPAIEDHSSKEQK